MALCFLLLSALFPGPNPPKDLNLDQSHFSCRLWRRPQYGHGFHTLWVQDFMGCTYGVQEMPKTYIIHKGRRDIWKRGPLQILCTLKGHRSVIAEANPHLGDGLWSVMFNTKGKFRVDCKEQKSIVLKRNMVLTIKKLFGVKEKKEATTILQFKKVNSKLFHKQVSMIQSKDSFKKNKIHAVAMIKNLIKPFVSMSQSETKKKVTEKLLNTYKTPIMHIQAKRQTDPHKKIQTTKTMYVIEKPASHRESIKAKSLQSMSIQKGSAFYSMKDVSKTLKIRLTKLNIVPDNIYNIKKLSDKTPTLVTTATALQKLKSAATNPEMQTPEDFNGEWDTQPNTHTKTEVEIDPELRFVTKEQTVKPQSTSQTFGLRMREESSDEESSDEKIVEEEGKGDVELENAGENPLCKGLIHQTEAGLVHCKDRLEKSNRKSIHRGLDGRESQSFHTGESDDAEYDHFYYFDGVLKRVKNNPLHQQS